MSEAQPGEAAKEGDHRPGDSLRDGRFVITGKLGEGGQGTTYDSVDKREGRSVIVKRFRVRGASSWKEVELAEREAKVLATLGHPNLPVYVDHFEEAGSLYLVTERIEGETVASLRTKGPIGEDDVVRFLRDASDVLDYLHGRAPPIVHRDVKPSNVIRRPDGSFAIIDFGAVRDRLKVTGSTVVGTFGYMAPEQFQGRAMPASDVYAVGTTAIAMLTGLEPEALPHKGLAIDVVAALGTSVPDDLSRALAAMVEPDPDRRASRIAPLLAGLRAPPPARSAKAARPREARASGEPPARDRDSSAAGSPWDEPSRWDGAGSDATSEAGKKAQRAVIEAEEQVKRVVEEVGQQVRRVVAEVSAGHGDGARREARRVAEVAKREAKRAFKEARRAARHGDHETREEARRRAEDARRAESEARRAARGSARPRGAPVGGPVLLVVLMALTIAQLAVLIGLKIVTPVVLYVVSAMFFGSIPGRAMRAAARHVSEAGTRANAAIGRAREVVRGRAPAAVEHVDPYAHTAVSTVSRKDGDERSAARVRVTDEPSRRGGARIDDGGDGGDGAEEEAAAEEEAGTKGQRRR